MYRSFVCVKVGRNVSRLLLVVTKFLKANLLLICKSPISCLTKYWLVTVLMTLV